MGGEISTAVITGEMKNKGYAKLGGGGAQIRCIMGDVQLRINSNC